MAISTWSFSADGNGAAVTLKDDSDLDNVMIHASGTWGSGTLKFQGSVTAAGSDWVDITNMTGINANTCKYVELTGLKRIRPVLSGSTSPSLTVNLAGTKVPVTVN